MRFLGDWDCDCRLAVAASGEGGFRRAGADGDAFLSAAATAVVAAVPLVRATRRRSLLACLLLWRLLLPEPLLLRLALLLLALLLLALPL